jgi:hypothetical protein
MDGQTKKSKISSNSKPKVVCTFCGVSFSKETTLLAHNCEPKRRHQQKDEIGVRFGFRCFQKFYNLLRPTDADKSYEEFSASPYYLAFVKFGRYLVDIRAVAPESYCDWLLKNNKKIDQWTKDSFYDEYLIDHLRKESVTDAMERSIETMTVWAEENSARYQDYFKYGSSSRICFDIQRGRISPWVIYASQTGNDFLAGLDDKSLQLIWQFIDSDYWNQNLSKRDIDFKWAQKILNQAGI